VDVVQATWTPSGRDIVPTQQVSGQPGEGHSASSGAPSDHLSGTAFVTALPALATTVALDAAPDCLAG
jgi:hypothetical protein